MKTKEEKTSAEVDKKKNIHEGHRARLIDTACKVGLENLSPVQIMELFLYYIIPRVDTNPIAHRLLDRFDTFTHVMEADIADLKFVEGIGQRSAQLISLFKEFFYHFEESKVSKLRTVKNMHDVLDIVEDYLRFRNTEYALLVAFSPSHRVISKRLVSNNDQKHVEVSVLEISAFISSSNATSIVIAHNHPYGKAIPSENDSSGFERVKNFCDSCGVNLIDSLIVGEDGVFGQRKDTLLRYYRDVDEVVGSLALLSKK